MLALSRDAMTRAARGLALVVELGMLGALPACERGCVARERIDEVRRGVAPGAGGAGPSGSVGHIDLGGTDCSDGLARCVHGTLEVSRLAHLPSPCVSPGASPERSAAACACPWESAGPCRQGCALEGALVVVPPEAARAQLCKPAPDELTARPPRADELARVDVCPEDGARCRDGIVHRCERAGSPSRVLGACMLGCATEVAGVEAGEAETTDGLLAILCRRSTAERR